MDSHSPLNSVLPWVEELTRISGRLGPGLSSEVAATPIPPVYHVRQRFARPLIEDVAAAVGEEFRRPEVRARIRRGSRVCLAVGSRGIARIAEIVRAVAREV